MEQPALEARDDGVVLRVKVQPKASRDGVLGEQGGRIRIALTAPPVDGAANEALIRFLAGRLSVKRQQITIHSGERGRDKTLHIYGASLDAIREALVPPT